MTVQTFREMLARSPFQPVKLTLSSGQAYEIRHPEMALLTRTSLLTGLGLSLLVGVGTLCGALTGRLSLHC
jgi:hypothetical protein